MSEIKKNSRSAKTTALIIVLLIPLLVALVSYNIEKRQPMQTTNVSEMTLIDLNGKEFKFTKPIGNTEGGDPLSNPVAFFLEMNNNSTPEARLPEPLEGTRYYKATFTRYGNEFSYRYYFTDTADSSYYLDEKSNCYKLPANYVQAFYQTEWAMSMFEGATPPELTLANGDSITPEKIEWVYPTVSGSFAKYEKSAMGADITEHNMSESVTLNFSVEPDVVHVTVTSLDDASELFDGLYEDLSMTQIEPNTKMSLSVIAEWNEQTALNTPYGAAEYLFTAVYTDAPVFTLGSKTINPGEFTVVSVKNVVDPSTLNFASEPSIDFTPIFFLDGSYYRALVPISYDLEHASSYTFTVSADGVVGTLILSVNEKSFANKSTDISAETANATRTTETLKEFDTNMADVYSKQETRPYFDGKFKDATGSSGDDGVVRTGYGVNRSITSQGITYRHNGVDYSTSAGDSVYAVNAGVVSYVGEQKLTGKLVVIDHGFGLKSTYAHLGNINVKVGDTVKTRDKIATAGSGGFTDGKNVHVMLSVFDVPVSIYPLWENGVVFE